MLFVIDFPAHLREDRVKLSIWVVNYQKPQMTSLAYSLFLVDEYLNNLDKNTKSFHGMKI